MSLFGQLDVDQLVLGVGLLINLDAEIFSLPKVLSCELALSKLKLATLIGFLDLLHALHVVFHLLREEGRLSPQK